MANPQDFSRHPELRAHFDAVYDLLRAGRPAREAQPALHVHSGDGSALAAVMQGTDCCGVAVTNADRNAWSGPPRFAPLRAGVEALPFAAGAFAASLSMDALEWFPDPAAALQEQARVTAGPVVVMHTDWHSLWLDSEDPDTSREFVRLFAGPPDEGVGARLAEIVAAAGLRVRETQVHPIRCERNDPETYAHHLLAQLRDWLVLELGAIRARRFDAWRDALDDRAATGAFALTLNRHLVVADGGEAHPRRQQRRSPD